MRALSISLFFFTLLGCDPPCVLNTQCGTQEQCVEGVCRRQCTTYYECAEGEVCYSGTCQQAPPGFCQDLVNGRAGDAGVGSGPLCPEPDYGPMEMGVNLDEGRPIDQLSEDMNPTPSRDRGADMTPSGGTEGGGTTAGTAGVEDGEMGVAGHQGGMEGTDMDMGMTPTDDTGPKDMMTDPVDLGPEMDMMRPVSLTPWLYTFNNGIYQTGQRRWVGRGVNLHDTRSCDACTWTPPNVGEVMRRIDEVVDVWGATLLRLNLESYPAANGRLQHRSIIEDQAYLRDIETIVHHVGTKTGTYIMLSIWRDPSLTDEGWPSAQTNDLLALLATRFFDTPQVIFGVSHEPRQNEGGVRNPDCWIAMNNAVEAIRAVERPLGSNRHLVAVQGTRDQGSDLSYYIEHPITADGGQNVIYETHIFNPQSDFDRLLINPTQTLPTIIGAFGPRNHPTNMTQVDAIALIVEAERQDVSWTAWTFHMNCQSSALFEDRSESGCGVNMPLIPTEWGQVVQGQLRNP
jgi:hypothetical protein